MARAVDPGVLAQRLYRGDVEVSREEREVLLYLVFNPESNRCSLQIIAKQLRVSKNTVLAAVADLCGRGYIDKSVCAEPGKRKSTAYTILSHPDLTIETSTESASTRTDSSSPSVPMRTDASGSANAPSDHRKSSSLSMPGRAELVEAAREIEWLFKGKGGYIPFRELNDAVEDLINARGLQEYRQFGQWLSVGPWRGLSLSTLPALIERWDSERISRGEISAEAGR